MNNEHNLIEVKFKLLGHIDGILWRDMVIMDTTHSLTAGLDQSHRSKRVVPTYVPAGIRSRGFVAAMFCPSGCGAVVP